MIKVGTIKKPNLIKSNSLDSNTEKEQDLFIVQTANDCIEFAKSQPIPKMLFSEFWHEGELSILFADTNVGKSILAVQIADYISNGMGFQGFIVEIPPKKVLLFDFELSQKQFEKRYSNDFRNHYSFNNNFFRAYINPNSLNFEDFEITLFRNLEKEILHTGANILIVDNITYLKSQSTETAKEALPLMKELNNLKQKYNLSILVLAHTPKRSNLNPITVNDLAGSKHLANFADSVFAIGTSQKDKSIRYIKQIKARATEKFYDYDNVIVCEITKKDNFLGFTFLEFGNEFLHLKTIGENESKELTESIIGMFKAEPGISQRKIAERLGVYPMVITRAVQKIKKDNKFDFKNMEFVTSVTDITSVTSVTPVTSTDENLCGFNCG